MTRRPPRSSSPRRVPPLLVGLAAAASLQLAGCHRDDAHASGDGTGNDTGNTDGTTADATDGTADSTDGPTTGGDTGETMIEPAPGGLRRLVGREYVATIELLLGPEAAAAAVPPADISQEGFDAVGASLVALDSVAVEGYETSARAVADAAVAHPETLGAVAPCVVSSADANCYVDVATAFGRLAYRRPLEQAEIDLLVAVAEHGMDWGEGDFEAGLKYQLSAILQMPSFLYLVEVGEPDPDSGFRKLNPYELASRMSIFLLGRGPDKGLLDRAGGGQLDGEEAIRNEAAAMVASARARDALGGFFDEYLRLRNLPDDSKNAELYPLFDGDLARAMRQESQLLVHDIVWEQDGDYRELFTADYTFVNDRLAGLYGITPPGQGEIYARVNWPASQQRAGYLSQASFLTHQASSLRTSPTKRGRFIQQSVLCEDIPPPPPGVNPTLPPLPADSTVREQLLMHMTEDSCNGCHGRTDPLGFAFEFYDAIGAYRTTEPNGRALSAQGEIEDLGNWNNAQELADILAADPRTSSCFVKNLIRGELGHRETDGEADAIAALDQTFADAGYSVQTLLVEFPTSPLFQLVDEPK